MSNPNKDTKPPSTATKQSRRRKNKVVERNPTEIIRTESPEVQIHLESMVNDDLLSNSGTFDGNNTIANYLRQSGRVSFSDVLTHTTKYLKKKRRENHGNKNENGARDKKHNFFVPLTMNPKNPVVNKERLNYSVYLDEEDDCQLIIHILRKSAMARTREELLFLQKAFADIRFFMEVSTQLDHACLLHLFKKLNIERYSAGQKIFSQGEVGTKFYVIIKGSTFVLVKKDGIVHLEDGEKFDYTCTTTERNERLAECLNGGAPHEVKKKEVEHHYPDCWIVRTLTQGDSFGEIGLQKVGSRARTATIVCQEETLVGTLAYDDYQATLAKLYERQYNDKINLFERIDAFRHWRRNHISALFLQLEEVKIQRKKIVIRQGEISNYIYFIKTGEIELHKIVNSPNEDDVSEPLNTFEDREPMLRAQPSKLKKPEFVKLGKITIGDYFGVSDTLERIPSLFTATVSSDEVVLMRITRDRFLKFVKDRQTLKSLREHIRRRDQWHLDMVAKTMNVNNQFSSKVWLDPKDQPDFFESHSPFTKKVEFIAMNDENVSIVSKFPIPIAGLKSAGSSPRVNFAVRPKTSLPNSPRSVIVVTNTVKDPAKVTQEHLNSQKFFARSNNTKDFKHGVTYQKNQNKLKKFFEREKQEKQQKEKETNEKARPKLKIVSPEQVVVAQSHNNLKDISVSLVLQKRDSSLPNSPEKSPFKKDRISSPLFLRDRVASLSLQKINGNDILTRRLSTDDFKPSSNPSTPGMRISAFSIQFPKHAKTNSQNESSQKSLTNLPSEAPLSNSFFKKSSTYYTFTHERFNTDDSIDSKNSQSTKRNSLNDINSKRRVSSAQKEFRLSSFNPKMKS